MPSKTMTHRKRAFFVDDDRDFLEMLGYVLRHPQFEVHTCVSESGYRTIDDIIRAKPDILFIDFHLPQATGSQVISVLKAIGGTANMPIYVVTGYPREKVEDFLEGVEYNGLIVKDEHLTDEILRVLDAAA